MSAFVLVLAAGIGVGTGPGAVSCEAAEQPLDLRGEWTGFMYDGTRCVGKVSVSRGHCEVEGLDLNPGGNWRVTDEGYGRLRHNLFSMEWLGVYRRDGDRLLICSCRKRLCCPASVRPGEGQLLLDLRRVRPGK